MIHGRIVNLGELMRKKGYTARDIAGLLQVGDTTVYGWMRGRCCPESTKAIDDLCRILGPLLIMPFSGTEQDGFYVIPNIPGASFEVGDVYPKTFFRKVFDTIFGR